MANSIATASWSDKQILPPNPEIGRLDEVLANVAVVRFAKNEYNLVERDGNTKPYFRIIKPLLSPERGVSRKPFESLRDVEKRNIDRIREIEDLLMRTYVVEYDEEVAPELFCRKIATACGEIEIAEPYYLQRPCGEFIPNDPKLAEQKLLETISAFEAWDIYKGDSAIVIGISDTGVMQDHEDLENKLWTNEGEIPNNGVDDDDNGYVDDWQGCNFSYADDGTEPGVTIDGEGHGTGVAGIAAAAVNNEIGIAGVAPNVSIFPLKTAISPKPSIVYGFESIIYAADMGLDVVNCSWGGGSYSCWNELAVEYAVARGIIIVVAGGNNGNYRKFYPAAYSGVLAVGVTNPRDSVVKTSNFGEFIDVFAPGHESITTLNSGYGRFCCTSGAAPIVSAACAMLKGLRPELDNLQIAELCRLSTNPVYTDSEFRKPFLRGSVDLLKAFTRQPFKTPSIRPEKYKFVSTSGEEIRRFEPGDTVEVRIDAKNYLGAAEKLRVRMTTVGDSLNLLRVLTSERSIGAVESGGNIEIARFFFIVKEMGDENIFLKFSALDGEYNDFFLVPLDINPQTTTFKNDVLALTMYDDGRVGYSQPPEREPGFSFMGGCSMLAYGGIMASENESKAVSSVISGRNFEKSFVVEKPFAAPNENIAIIRDDIAPNDNRIGIEIQTRVELPEGDAPYARIKTRVTNISGETLRDLSCAYFFDWDVGFRGADNYYRIFSEGLPTSLEGKPAAAAIIARDGDYEYVGTSVFSEDSFAQPQMTAFDNEIVFDDDGFSISDKIILLNGGVSATYTEKGDLSQVIGMKFPGEIAPGESREYATCICAAENEYRLALYMRHCADTTVSSKRDEIFACGDVRIFPNPAEGKINAIIPGGFTAKFELVNLFGETTLSGNLYPNIENTINAAALVPGAYILKIYLPGEIKAEKIILR